MDRVQWVRVKLPRGEYDSTPLKHAIMDYAIIGEERYCYEALHAGRKDHKAMDAPPLGGQSPRQWARFLSSPAMFSSPHLKQIPHRLILGLLAPERGAQCRCSACAHELVQHGRGHEQDSAEVHAEACFRRHVQPEPLPPDPQGDTAAAPA